MSIWRVPCEYYRQMAWRCDNLRIHFMFPGAIFMELRVLFGKALSPSLPIGFPRTYMVCLIEIKSNNSLSMSIFSRKKQEEILVIPHQRNWANGISLFKIMPLNR